MPMTVSWFTMTLSAKSSALHPGSHLFSTLISLLALSTPTSNPLALHFSLHSPPSPLPSPLLLLLLLLGSPTEIQEFSLSNLKNTWFFVLIGTVCVYSCEYDSFGGGYRPDPSTVPLSYNKLFSLPQELYDTDWCYQGHCIRAHNRLVDPRNLVKARLAARNSVIVDPRHFSLLAIVRSLGPFSTIVEGRISLVASYAKGQRQQQRHVWDSDSDSDTSGALPGWLHCLSFLCARTMPLPARLLSSFARLPSAYLHRWCVPASACGACSGPFCTCALHLFARAFPVPARVLCLALGRYAQLWWVCQPHR